MEDKQKSSRFLCHENLHQSLSKEVLLGETKKHHLGRAALMALKGEETRFELVWRFEQSVRRSEGFVGLEPAIAIAAKSGHDHLVVWVRKEHAKRQSKQTLGASSKHCRRSFGRRCEEKPLCRLNDSDRVTISDIISECGPLTRKARGIWKTEKNFAMKDLEWAYSSE
ncbi:hypothetical protein HHI36_001771 [Cryptolaemus montrouzieri]|uniref:Uncharacterized protein n=1 Tax=Cryptolaemus montrouzieri TaxID=559131 RepID=A0ABD2P8K9_9CUCU